MTFQHILPIGPCTYPGHINTVPTCTTSLKLVLVFVFASNHTSVVSSFVSKEDPRQQVLQHKNLYRPRLSVRWSSSCLSHFFSITYGEDVGLFVSITRPRSRKKRVHLCQASIPNKHKGYPGRKGRPLQWGECPSWRKTNETRKVNEVDLRVSNFMKQHKISAEHAIELMGNYYSHDQPVTTWERTAKEELVNVITQGC